MSANSPQWETVVQGGYCVICESETAFEKRSPNIRRDFVCPRCDSTPRFRAIIAALNRFFPRWPDLCIHESSPNGAAAKLLRTKGRNYSWSHLFSDVPLGAYRGTDRCENLQSLTLASGTFDLFITQDVFEHVMDPAPAFSEIARVLKPGGAHVFTMPWYPDLSTTVQRAREVNGQIEHLLEPVYHGNPSSIERRSLVTFDWGMDFVDFIYRSSGLVTTVYLQHDPHRGIEGPFLEVFISRKQPGEAAKF